MLSLSRSPPPLNSEIKWLVEIAEFGSFDISKNLCLASGFGAVGSWNGLKGNNVDAVWGKYNLRIR